VPTTDCLPQLRLDFHREQPVVVSFDAPQISSDGGLLLVRQVDDALGLTAMVAAAMPDARDPRRVVHARAEQIRQRVFQIVHGYEDANDATALRHDPVLRVACDRRPDDPRGLSSQPTLSRLEHAATAHTVVQLQRALEQAYVDELPADTTCVVLDLDTTADPVYGQQPLAFFHGHYGQTMYFPALLFDGVGRLVSVRLRPGNAGNYRYAAPMLERVIRALKARFPAAQVVVRGDSGFAAPRVLDLLEALAAELGAVDYVFGFERNAAVLRLAADAMAVAAARFAETGVATRTFAAVRYRAKSWARDRHVVVKAKHLEHGPNPRFVVTTLTDFAPRVLYEWAYCGRGQAENHIKDLKNALAADRLSCTTYVANAFRLLLHAVAYRLLFALRTHVAAVAPALATAQFDTLRLRLLKVAATVRRTVRRLAIALPRAFPLATTFQAVAVALGAVVVMAR
jgi:hypothetical protein